MAQDTFQNCPNCEAMILSDTGTCPDCGHVLKEGADGNVATPERADSAKRECPRCHDMVPSGLVRCWSCNAFMVEEVGEKYRSMIKNPQQIIFSDVPPDQRTETIPPRFDRSKGGYARVLDADDSEFTLQGQEAEDHGGFELGDAAESSGDAGSKTDSPEAKNAPSSESSAKGAGEKSGGDSEAAGEANVDELLNIALTQEKESGQRKRERVAQARRKRILIPCNSCSSWLRVREEQSGRTVRCRNCKAPIFVPEIKTKEKTARKETAPELALVWVNDVHLHLIAPTDVALKPGSLEGTYQLADITFHEDSLHLVNLGGPPKKKSLFSRGPSEDDLKKQRQEIRDHIRTSGAISNLPHGELYTVTRDSADAVRLLQPLAHAHESMFAGVPVFGDGRIAIYLPLKLDEGRQAFCSFPISKYREFARNLSTAMNIRLRATENGVPEKDEVKGVICQYTQVRIEAIQERVYYEKDPAYELELAGYRCESCGAAVSEAGRAKNKLGGSSGKSIAKAKCPKCSNAMGRDPLYQIVKAPPLPDDEKEGGAETEASTEAPASAESSPADEVSPKVE